MKDLLLLDKKWDRVEYKVPFYYNEERAGWATVTQPFSLLPLDKRIELMKPKRPPTPPPQPPHNVYGNDGSVYPDKRKPENYLPREILQARINRMRREQNVLIGFIITGVVLAMLFGKTSARTVYEVFERNHNQCLQSEIFTQNQCYDIAYTAMFGE